MAAVSLLAAAPAVAAPIPILRRLHNVSVDPLLPVSDEWLPPEEIERRRAAAAARTPIASNPDDEGIRVCLAHHDAIRAVNEHRTGVDDDDPIWLAYERSKNAIHDFEPVTLAGMVAKARAAKAEARNPDGTESPSNCPAEDWAWDLVHDILRLGGAA
ncbi:hypothetical protein [Muricoccus radiodurans]|uniref:hypothetical protein n=1 Tax=Muricoccus radiodurans TaxID=2231721 RepID=UPI003CE80638